MSTQSISSSNAWASMTPPPALKLQLTIPLKLPSGATVEVTRPDLEIWFTSGALPQELLDVLLGVHSLDASEEIAAERARLAEESVMSDPVKARQALIFMREAVCAAVVKPRIKLGALGTDEIEPSRVPPDDFKFIFQWVLQGCPGVPVAVEGGVVAVEDVRRFRDVSGVRDVGDHGKDIPSHAERGERHQGQVDGDGIRPRRRRMAKKKRP